MVFKEKIQQMAWQMAWFIVCFVLFGGVEILILIRRYFFTQEPQESLFERFFLSWFGFGLCLIIPLLLFVALRFFRNYMTKPTTEEP